MGARLVLGVTVALSLLAPSRVHAQPPAVSKTPDGPPAAIPSALAGLLAPEGSRVALPDATLDFWWVRAVPIEAGVADASWAGVPSGALVGAIRLDGEWTDIRGYTIRPGVYTLRFALQPQNGDHLGISPYREFFLLAPAAEDQDPAAIGYEAAVKLSTKASRRSHPASMSLDPPRASNELHSLTTNEFGHDVVLFAIPAGAGATAGTLTFGLVVRGAIEH